MMKKILFNCSLILMIFITLNHLFVMLSFFTSSKILPLAFPLSLLASVIIYLFLEKRSKKTEKTRTIFLTLLVIIGSLAASAFYFDLSWDGQWYQQSAIYHLSSGWNPIFEPIRTFEENNDASIIHFPKGSWYFAASVFSTLGNFESGKSLNFILIFISIFIIFSTLHNFGMSETKSLIISVLAVLNPVVWSETTTYLVDGSLILYICIYTLMIFAWLREPGYKYVLIGSMSIIGIVNLKFTGLVFFCVLAFFAAICVLIFKRKYFLKFLGAHAIALFVSVIIFGYNPYVSNFIKRGHPLYPIIGTEKYPSIYEQTGRDDNEIYETPLNMQGKPLLTRMFYANFGRPDNAPYYKEKNAELIWPFTSKPIDWKAYYFHETRVGGFGPYFSAVFILSFLLSLIIIIKDRKSRWFIFFTLTAIFGSLLFSKHFWWPRFGPQMWLIPIIPLCFSFYRSISKRLNYYTWVITILMIINGGIVLYYHIGWETRSSITLRQQLTYLQNNNKPIEVFYGWFKKSIEEKLARRQIKYEAVSGRVMMNGDHMNLTSVVEGYPNMVLYREKKE